MLALVVAVALSQCTKDTDCKGYRICQEGTCVDPSDAPSTQPQVEHESVFTVPERQPEANPYRVHRLVGLSLVFGTWAVTVLGTLAICGNSFDGYCAMTLIPTVGPLLDFLVVSLNPNLQWNGATGPVLLITSSVLQIGSLAYFIAAAVNEANYQPRVALLPGPGLIGATVAARW